MNEVGVAYVPADRHRFGLILSLPAGRQPGPDQLLPGAVRPGHHPGSGRDRARRGDLDRALRHPDAVGDGPGEHPVRRQPAEGGRRPGVRPGPEAARARPADSRPRRRQHRVHPSPGDRQARRRDGRAARVGRARRGPRDVRPDRGDVRRPDRGRDGRPDSRQERGRPADGDRLASGARRRPRLRHDGSAGGTPPGRLARSAPGLGDPGRADRRDHPVPARRRDHHPRLGAPRHRPEVRSGAAAHRLWRAGPGRVRHDRRGDPDAGLQRAPPVRRPGRRLRLQGRPVQHRRPGPVPRRRARRGRRGGRPGRRTGADRDRGGDPRRDRLGRPVGLHPGLPQGRLGRPRGGQHDHAQLRRRAAPGGPRERPAQGPQVALAGHLRRRQRGLPDHHRDDRPHRDHPGAGRRGPRLVAPVPDDLGLRDPLGRRQPGRGPLRRDAARSS